MISDKLIVINRCQSRLCRRVVAYMSGTKSSMIEVIETGSDTCEHIYDPAHVVTVRRDVLILHALWTAGRHAVSVHMDPRAHVLADSLGYRAGDAIPVTEIPLQLVNIDGRELTWQGMCLAVRVAREVRDVWFATDAHVERWRAIVDYLSRWQHHIP